MPPSPWRGLGATLLLAAGARAAVPDYNSDASALRDLLIGDDSGYDKEVPPVGGANVAMQLVVDKLDTVDSSESVITMKVTLRMRWVDARLVWEPSSYGQIEQTFFAAGSFSEMEDTLLWVPDITVYNTKTRIVDTFDPGLAVVNYTGEVEWRRTGVLQVLCKFSGLVAFPYDRLICSSELGGWAMPGLYQNITLLEEGVHVVPATSSYAQYKIDEAQVTLAQKYYERSAFPNEVWPVLQVDFFFERRAQFRILLVIPTIFVTMLCFVVFFMRPEEVDRVSLGIGLLLVLEFIKYLTQVYLPVCGEIVWAEFFNGISELWAFLAFMESAVVLFMTYLDDKWVFPWLHAGPVAFKRWRWRRKYGSTSILGSSKWGSKRGLATDSPTNKGSGRLHLRENLRRKWASIDRCQLAAQSERQPTSVQVVAEHLKRKEAAEKEAKQVDFLKARNTRARQSSESLREKRRSLGGRILEAPLESSSGESLQAVPQGESLQGGLQGSLQGGPRIHFVEPSLSASSSVGVRVGVEPSLSFDANAAGKVQDMPYKAIMEYEQIFYKVDIEHNGYVARREAKHLLKCILVHIPDRELERGLDISNANKNDQLVRAEFVVLLSEFLEGVDTEQVEVGLENYLQLKKALHDHYAAYWYSWALFIDRQSRVLIIGSYIVALAFLFNIDFDDDYFTDPTAPMFMGFAPDISATRWGIFRMLATPLVFGVVLFYMLSLRAAVKYAGEGSVEDYLHQYEDVWKPEHQAKKAQRKQLMAEAGERLAQKWAAGPPVDAVSAALA